MAARSGQKKHPVERLEPQPLRRRRKHLVERPYERCCARCLFISNIVTFFAPKIGSSFSSARISRLFSGFWRLFDLMYFHTWLTISGRDKGLDPTTAASSVEG